MAQPTASNNPREQQMSLPWRYELGAIVTWAVDAPHDPPWTYRIVRRRYEHGAGYGQQATYLLEPIAPQYRWSAWWAYEGDVQLYGEPLAPAPSPC